MTSDWFAEIRAQGVRRVAAALGLSVHERPAHGIGPCPACGAERRHPRHGDRRLAVGVRPDNQGWRCMECDAHGDALTLAALVVTGSARPAAWGEVRARCAAEGLCEPDPHAEASTGPRRPRLVAPASIVPGPPRRPPRAEVLRLWLQCTRVADDAEVSAWLQSRGLNPADVEDRNLARALPAGVEVPHWAWGPGGSWSESGRRCIMPMFDAAGALVSLRARAIREVEGPKALAPAGFEVRGLELADALSRRLLEGAPLGDGSSAADLVKRVGVMICEGEPTFLAAATLWSDADEDAPAVLGIVAGSWTDEIAARIPTGTRVVLDVDADAAGDKYVAQIAATLAARCDLRDARRVAV